MRSYSRDSLARGYWGAAYQSVTRVKGLKAAPKSDDEVTRVTALDAFKRVQAGKAILYDTRGAEYFAAGHAQGAISLPVADIERDPIDARRRMLSGKLAVFYCT
ncbi:MAG: rhodanese-like domain-containing protein [Chloroflexi bacterium]|nr:MAG: rhodanese-like domain-containing protein [Chloroflexota bacterium]